MLESVPQEMLPYFNDDFISSAISFVIDTSFDVKKEAAYFLSTLIVFSDPEVVPRFMTQEVTDILVEMLGCGVDMIQMRCLDSFFRFIYIMKRNPQYESYLNLLKDSDIMDRLNDLVDPNSPQLTERAEYLLQQLQTFSS